MKLTLLSHYGSRLAETIKLICTEFVIGGEPAGPLCCKGFAPAGEQMYRKVKVGCLVVSLTVCLIQVSWIDCSATYIGHYR
ncbi:hypothetical protein EMIT051CA3_30075 [Pseudomonas chlororaphis]